MIIGNPYEFAIVFDRVKQWNSTNKENNGFFALSVDGTLFPNIVNNTVINSALYDVEKSLKNIPVDDEMFSLDKKDALEEIFNLVYPCDFSIDNDYRYELSPIALTDESCFVFAVKAQDNVRILAATLEYDRENSTYLFDNITVKEVILSRDIMKEIISEVQKELCT